MNLVAKGKYTFSRSVRISKTQLYLHFYIPAAGEWQIKPAAR